MTTEVKVPDIGDFSDVPVITVLVSVGDTVAQEDPLVELESDKATMEVPSSAAGKVAEIKVAEGDTINQGDVILLLEGDAAQEASDDTAQEAEKDAAEDKPDKADTSAAPADAEPPKPPKSPADAAPSRAPDFTGVHASPSVRAFARSLDVDLNEISGSGRKGRILREDVTEAYKSASGPAGAGMAAEGGMGIPPIPEVDFSQFGPVEDVEMPRIKKLSGPALHRSWLNIPHVTHNDEADITDLDAYRRELDAEAKADGYRVTLLSFAIKASVSALRRHWEVNSSLHPDGDKLIRKDFYNIGFAADTPDGLMVPVIKDADRKGIIAISKELGDLSAKARDGKLKGEDMKGATFTISSLGGIGGTSFTPIVNAPEVAILGLTRSKMAPVWDGAEFQPRNMLPLSLSYDHRAIDGALAARFCATLANLLGDMRRMML